MSVVLIQACHSDPQAKNLRIFADAATKDDLRKKHPPASLYTRVIMTSVDFIKAAAFSPFRSFISRTASAVMIEVIF
jgi:hypothetical protein